MTRSDDSFMDSRDFARIARAIGYIDASFRKQPKLQEIAAGAGLSEFHFNRLFRRWAGVTPKQYLAFVTGSAAKQALQRQPVLDAALSVGLSGPGRLHDLIVTLEAMTPGEFKARGAGAEVRFGFTATPFGTALIGGTARGICHMSFIEVDAEQAAVRALQGQWDRASLKLDTGYAQQAARQIWSSPAGPMRVHVAGTNFQLQVWQALLQLAQDRTTTYADVAAAIGQTSGARAVGNAVGANPVAWLIPCHGVLRKDGGLGGYRWGAERKRAIQAWSAMPRNMSINA